MFEYLNRVETSLLPITKEYWEKMHVWPYECIASKIKDDSVVDVGSGCGLLGIYLVYRGYVKTATLFDVRKKQVDYAKKLVKLMQLEDRVEVREKYYQNDFVDRTIVTTRFGSLLEFEKFYYRNRLITLRRGKDCEPFFKREMTLPWEIDIVTRSDQFSMELLTFDYEKALTNVVVNERWMESLTDETVAFVKTLNMKMVEHIGGDFLEPT